LGKSEKQAIKRAGGERICHDPAAAPQRQEKAGKKKDTLSCCGPPENIIGKILSKNLDSLADSSIMPN
jgi:hypothetical protein